LVWVEAEALFQSKFYRSDNMKQLLRYLKNQANKQRELISNPYTRPLDTTTNTKENPSEYHEGIISSGDRNHNRP